MCLESNDGVTDDDNCCHCHLAAIQRITGIDEEDFVHINLRNKVCVFPGDFFFKFVFDQKMQKLHTHKLFSL